MKFYMKRPVVLLCAILLLAGGASLTVLHLFNRRSVSVTRVRPPLKPQATIAAPVRLPIRLAIGTVASGSAPRANLRMDALRDLVTVELGRHDGFTLVERREVDRALEEVARSLEQNNEQQIALKAGKMLGCDWFLVDTCPSARTNVAVFKIVDVHSSIVRDMTAIAPDPLPQAAAEVARFTAGATNNVAFNQRLFVGLGSFSDWSVNERYPTFTTDLRHGLEQAAIGRSIRFVERGAIHALLREMQFNATGLTDRPGTNGAAQPAMYLVDGFFQSVQDEQAKVSVALRIHCVGGREELFTYTDPQGPALVKRMTAQIEAFMGAQPPRRRPVSSVEEARIQLARGREHAGFRGSMHSGFMVGGVALHREPEKRKRNIEAAIEAFESALFLDPSLDEAKLGLGICLADPQIERVGEGQEYFRDVIARSTIQQWVAEARRELAETLPKPTPRVMTLSEKVEEATQAWLEKCKATQHAADKNEITNPFDLTDNTYNVFLRIHSFDSAATRRSLDGILTRLETDHPRLAHYFAGSYARWCARHGGATPAQFDKLKAVLDSCEREPSRVGSRSWYYAQTLWPDVDLCFRSNRLDIVRQALGLAEKLDGATLSRSADYLLRKGDMLMRTDQWKEAVTVFETLSGPFHNKDVSQQLTLCRARLGNVPSPESPGEFDLGRPFRLFLEAPVLKHDGGQLWVAVNETLHVFADEKWREVAGPEGFRGIITALAMNERFLALGTRQSGVFIRAMKATQWRRFGTEDGLLIASIESLHFLGDKLWIGFGDPDTRHGGIGYLDMETERFAGLTPELKLVQGSLLTDTFDQPPKARVVAINNTSSLLWVAAKGKGLQRFDTRLRTWDLANSSRSFDNTVPTPALSDGANSVTSLGLSAQYLIVGTDRSGSHSSTDKYWGGTSFYNFASREWRIVAEPQGLPNGNVYCVATDGMHLWAGGRSFVAEIDPARAAVTRAARIGGAWTHAIEVGPRDVWIAAGNQLFRLPHAH